MSAEPIQVRCYAGHKAEELPRSFIWRGQEFHVQEVLSSRREEKAKRRWGRKIIFRVKVDTGRVFEISYHEQADKWLMEKAVK